ncbi:transposase [Anaerosolibacter sp.]|uniref:transposase n=1 Tax=Anaerosolibacter sp. TaxID=1872527 RepID=UPI0039EF570B
MNCLNNTKQVSLFELYESISTMSYQCPKDFLTLLKEHFDISIFIPDSFKNAYYADLGRDREFSIESMLSGLLIMHFLNIPSVTLLWHFLYFSKELSQEYCGFTKSIPSESVFSKFKTAFSNEIENFFHELVKAVIPASQKLDEALPNDHPFKGASETLIYDTTGVKPVVKENNPKYLATEVKNQKKLAKLINNPSFIPQLAAFAAMPKAAEANEKIKLDFLNGHFSYFYKFGMVTNGFGIPLYIHFFDDLNIMLDHTTYTNPKELKGASDNASLKPVLDKFFSLYPNQTFTQFLGDAEFDSFANYSYLKENHFKKVFIPLNTRNTSETSINTDILLNEDGIPLCPKNPSKTFKADGTCNGKKRSLRFKFICPSAKRMGTKLVCLCDDPCSDSEKVRTYYAYPDQNFRMYPGLLRSSEEWISRYKTRTVIERTNASLKTNYCVTQPKSLNLKSIRSDIYLSACTKIITVLLAYAIHKPEYIKSRAKLLKYSA